MKQIFQNINNGKVFIDDIPTPNIDQNSALIQTELTLISSGTERSLIDFGKSSLFQKAKKRPDQIKKIINKVKTDGILDTYSAVTSKLDQPFPLGYCNVGTIVDSNHSEFSINQRVVSNGHHAEFVTSKKNSMVILPDNVHSDEASFSVLGSIALNAIRQLNCSIGETVVVLGLGLIGQITCKLLSASGLNVIAIDTNSERCSLAKADGIITINELDEEKQIEIIKSHTNNNGADGIIIAAHNANQELLNNAAKLSRKNGLIILLGQIKNNFDRRLFYEKELSFKVSSSYGPGRYDYNYEEKGIDYPLHLVRWTSNRNIQTIIKLLSLNKISFKNLISKKIDLSNALEAYDLLNNNKYLGIIINFKNFNNKQSKLTYTVQNKNFSKKDKTKINVGFIGAGNYASRVLLPLLKKNKNLTLKNLVSINGLNSKYHGNKNGFVYSSSLDQDIFDDKEINTVFITTRHNLHYSQIIKSLESGKHVFVEKPITLKEDEFNQLCSKYENINKDQKNKLKIMIGYNRRFSPLTKLTKNLLNSYQAKKIFIRYDIHAGQIPNDHWLRDFEVGGGRFLGEGVHFIDYAYYLINKKITKYHCIGTKNDGFSASLFFEDNSIANINYIVDSSPNLEKEKIEVHFNDKSIQINNFKEIKFLNIKRLNKNLFKIDKGQNDMVNEFLNSVEKNLDSPINFEDIKYLTKIIYDMNNKLN